MSLSPPNGTASELLVVADTGHVSRDAARLGCQNTSLGMGSVIMMGVACTRRAGLFAVLLLTPLFAFAADLASAKKGEYTTFIGSSFGKLAITVDDESGFIGTFDKGGKIATKIDGTRAVGRHLERLRS
jgi:hypothetical protein